MLKDRIVDIRKKQEITQQQFAEDLGISVSDVNRIEKGDAVPSETILRLISLSYGVPLTWLQGSSEEHSNTIIQTKQGINFSLIEEILRFRDERNWKQFHTPKDLSISLCLESAELLECFQWSGTDTQVIDKIEYMKEELADIFIYSILMASSLDLDISTIIKDKLQKNKLHYPVKKAFGNAKKYSELSKDDCLL